MTMVGLDQVPAALLIVDDVGCVVAANARARAVVGDVVGAAFASLFVVDVNDDAEQRPVARVARLAQPPLLVGYTMSAPHDGQRVVCFQDITRIVALREERDRLLRLAVIADVLPTVLHEVKNPLAAVATGIELLLDDNALPEQAQRDLHAMLGELRRARLTLDGVGIAGRELAAHRPEAIDHAVVEAVRVLEPRARDLGVALTADVAPLPLLPFDPGALRAIVFNLVQNALQATPQGGAVRVNLSLSRRDNTLALVVEDGGVGMSPEVRARCRELFFSTKPRGSGIGLALVDHLVRDVGGAVAIDSAVGRGTRIALYLPVPSEPSSRAAPPPRAS